jgi:hypothetical protein
MKNFLKYIPIIYLGLVTACATTHPDNTTATSALNQCKDPRPEVCTQDYRPVCATLQDGLHKVYSNGCMACSDTMVESWVEGECGN